MGAEHPGRWHHDLRRPMEGRLIAGVCVGLAERLQLEVTLLRLTALLLVLASGLGLVIYLLLWVIIPDAEGELPPWRSTRARMRWNLRGMGTDLQRVWDGLVRAWSRSGQSALWPRPLTRRWVALGLIAVGTLILLQSLGVFAWLGPWRSLGLAIIAIGGSVLAYNSTSWRRHGEKEPDHW